MGTGTGYVIIQNAFCGSESSNSPSYSAWLLDVRDHLPRDVQLTGFDISFDAAPPMETLPSNVNFQLWNVKESIPDGLFEVFEVVHVRFLSFVLLNDEIPDVIAKIFRMLSKSFPARFTCPYFNNDC